MAKNTSKQTTRYNLFLILIVIISLVILVIFIVFGLTFLIKNINLLLKPQTIEKNKNYLEIEKAKNLLEKIKTQQPGD